MASVDLPVPADFDDLTPEWLTRALASSGHIQEARATGVTIEPLSEGVGFLGLVARVRVDYDRPDAGPATLIAKLPRPDPQLAERTRPLRLFEREIGFYRELAPRTPIRLPRCWYTAMDTSKDRFILLIEDLAPARLGDQLEGCSAAEAALVIQELARLHATWWNHPLLAQLDWLFPVNDARQKSLEERYREAWPIALQRWKAKLSPALQSFGELYGYRFGWVVDQLLAMPNTVEHADVRLDNILFGERDGASWVSILDWQAPTRGGGMQDVGYFLSQSLPVDVRRAHERELLDMYFTTLQQFGVGEYSRAQAEAEYRIGVLWGWLVPIWAAGNVDLTVPRAGQLWDACFERALAAVDDLEAARLLPA